MCWIHSCRYNRFRVLFFQMNIYLRTFPLKMIEMTFLFSGWCQTICSWMHVIFLIFVHVSLYNVNKRSICVLKHPDVLFIFVQKMLTYTLNRLCFEQCDEILFDMYIMGSQRGRKRNSSICVYRTSCLRYQTCWESILFVCEICGQMVTIVRLLRLNLMRVIWKNTGF
jgi:hypothetical protein